MNQITIVMYHYVRDLASSRYPEIRGLSLTQFNEQLAYLERFYEFVTVEQCLEAMHGGKALPKNSAMLTFDDAYLDHFTCVFPALDKRGIQGVFFPPAKAILHHEVLDVNKIHFVLASIPDSALLVQRIYQLLEQYRSDFSLESNDFYYEKLAHASRFDTADIIFAKRLLQKELPHELRQILVNRLFEEFVTDNERMFSQELYMSVEQIRCLQHHGMFIGSHGYDHFWLGSLSPEEQECEVDLSLNFLEEVGASTNHWFMCYPYGNYNQSLLDIIHRKGAALGVSTEVNIASLEKNPLTLPRLDTNDLPKERNQAANQWTEQIL